MNLLSVCSGIEAATVAWHPLGWSPFGFAETAEHPSAVLSHHYGSNLPGEAWSHNAPPNLGNMQGFKDWPDATLDLLVGGTPCQSFSVAGLRKGIADPRGNLCLTFLAIADRYRPEWLLWENVPGVLSSNGGRDFGAFLGGLGQLGYGWAYRVLDAQYIRVDGFARAVPQRRRRVFVVGHLGDWRRAAAVLFERESLQGDTAPRRQTGQNVAPTISARPTGGGGLGTDFDCDGGLVARALTAHPSRIDGETKIETFVAHALRAEGFDASEDGTGRGTPLAPVGFTQNSRSEVRLLGGDGSVVGAVTSEPGAQCQNYVAFTCKDYGGDAEHDLSPTLRAGGFTTSHANAGVMPAVAYDMRGRDGGAQFEGPHDTANIRAASGGSSRSYVAERWAVRRLTPRECERLQGFPDGYTAVPFRGKPMADGPRYKMLGNSMAVNAMRWIGRRIELVSRMTTSIKTSQR